MKIKRNNIKWVNIKCNTYYSKIRLITYKFYALSLTYKRESFKFISDKETININMKWGDKMVFSI